MTKRRIRTKSIEDQLKAAIRHAESEGWSQYEIAKKAGIDRGQLTRLFSGTVHPRLDTAERIAKALGYQIILKPMR